jgi:hypothetical protein
VPANMFSNHDANPPQASSHGIVDKSNAFPFPQAEVIAKGMLRKTAELLFQSARMGYKVLLTHVLNSVEYNYLQEPAIRSIQVI